MKEYDYSKWDNKPREMWVWDCNKNSRVKRFVTFVCPNHVLVLTEGAVDCMWWKYCAEIEPARRMTNYELARWLWEGTQVGEFREVLNCGIVTSNHTYSSNVDVSKDTKIRINGGEWKEPLVEE